MLHPFGLEPLMRALEQEREEAILRAQRARRARLARRAGPSRWQVVAARWRAMWSRPARDTAPTADLGLELGRMETWRPGAEACVACPVPDPMDGGPAWPSS
jgi:hypothetical protein